MQWHKNVIGTCVWMVLWALSSGSSAAEVLAAVAANFAEPARAIAAAYGRQGGTRVDVSVGSTGGLYAQIKHGAPFDVFLAADAATPERLVASGLAIGDTRFTYAVGSLMMWSADPERIKGDCRGALHGVDGERIAIANPAIAPYGAAAQASLQAWGLWATLVPHLLRAESVGQAFQFAATGNAAVAFVARSQVLSLNSKRAGSWCVVEPGVYPPIRQQAVLLRHGRDNAAAQRFLTFLRGKQAAAILHRYGYEMEKP